MERVLWNMCSMTGFRDARFYFRWRWKNVVTSVGRWLDTDTIEFARLVCECMDE